MSVSVSRMEMAWVFVLYQRDIITSAFKTWYSQDAKEKYTVGYRSVDNQS